MKKVILGLGFLFLFYFSTLNAFVLKFGEGTNYEGTFKPVIFNVNVFSYYDNGSIYNNDAYILDLIIKVESKNFNPKNAKVYATINDNLTKELDYYFVNSNVPPGYIDTYIFVGKITPMDYNYDYNYEGYISMLENIDNITFYFEYNGETYRYTFDNMSQYMGFLEEFNHSITGIDTSNYPVVTWNLDPDTTIDDLGVCVLDGNDENWNDPETPDIGKVDYDSKAEFGEWYHADNIPQQIDFTTIPNIIIPGEVEHLILKVKSEIKADVNEDNPGSNIYRFQAAFKKIPQERIVSITTISGWRLFGAGDDEIYKEDFSGIFDVNKISTIWSWVNNSWSVWSPDDYIMSIISDYGINPLYLVYPHNGFWINFK